MLYHKKSWLIFFIPYLFRKINVPAFQYNIPKARHANIINTITAI